MKTRETILKEILLYINNDKFYTLIEKIDNIYIISHSFSNTFIANIIKIIKNSNYLFFVSDISDKPGYTKIVIYNKNF